MDNNLFVNVTVHDSNGRGRLLSPASNQQTESAFVYDDERSLHRTGVRGWASGCLWILLILMLLMTCLNTAVLVLTIHWLNLYPWNLSVQSIAVGAGARFMQPLEVDSLNFVGPAAYIASLEDLKIFLKDSTKLQITQNSDNLIQLVGSQCGDSSASGCAGKGSHVTVRTDNMAVLTEGNSQPFFNTSSLDDVFPSLAGSLVAKQLYVNEFLSPINEHDPFEINSSFSSRLLAHRDVSVFARSVNLLSNQALTMSMRLEAANGEIILNTNNQFGDFARSKDTGFYTRRTLPGIYLPGLMMNRGSRPLTKVTSTQSGSVVCACLLSSGIVVQLFTVPYPYGCHQANEYEDPCAISNPPAF